MQRYRHADDWKPNPKKPHWFAYWDVCGRCHRVQHYEAAKRWPGNVPATAPFVTHMVPERCPPGWLEGPYDEMKPPWVECRLDGRTNAEMLPRDPTPVEWTEDEPRFL